MTFIVTFVQDEHGAFVAECPAIPGCVSQGKTADEAERHIRDAIRECLAVGREQGLPLTIKSSAARDRGVGRGRDPDWLIDTSKSPIDRGLSEFRLG